jgi:hypothetical protein
MSRMVGLWSYTSTPPYVLMAWFLINEAQRQIYKYFKINLPPWILESVQYIYSQVKVKLSLYQAVEAHTVVRRRGSHIFSR